MRCLGICTAYGRLCSTANCMFAHHFA
jgi:hypothetical protein